MQTLRPVTKPNKQRKMLYEAPDHVRHKLLAAHLSPELRATHIVKSLSVRSGDTVRIMRGDHKSFEGKITRIDLKKYRIYLEGLTREKVDGTTIFLPVHPSKVMVTRLNLDDKWRKRILERKQKAHKKPEKPAKKPELEALEKPPETAELKEPSEQKVAAIEKPQKKKAAKGRKKARKSPAPKKEAQSEETKRERKPGAERKRTKRKATKKTEEGGG
jgi:large subunit ribosomal protein L24